jgi:GTP-binding protein EngB required for normal cell division
MIEHDQMSQLLMQSNDMDSLELPEVIYAFTKSDKVGYQGSLKQKKEIEGFIQEGIVGKYFLVSSTNLEGIQELKSYLFTL